MKTFSFLCLFTLIHLFSCSRLEVLKSRSLAQVVVSDEYSFRDSVTWGHEISFSNQELIEDFRSAWDNYENYKKSIEGTLDPNRPLISRIQSPRAAGELAALDRKKIVTEANLRVQSFFAEYVKGLCQERDECVVTKEKRKWGIADDFVVTFKSDNWAFRISLDESIIEIITSPSTKASLDMNERIEEYIFSAALKVGLTTTLYRGGGHIHIGVESAFRGNAVLFRNFLVDYYNNPNIWRGILGNAPDDHNATLISDLPKEYGEEFVKIIEEFDSGKHPTIYDLAKQIEDRVYLWNRKGTTLIRKFQLINLTRIIDFKGEPSMQTIEIRGFKEFQSVEEFNMKTELVLKRLEFVSEIKGRIAASEFSRVSKFNKDSLYSRAGKVLGSYLYETGFDNPREVARVLIPDAKKSLIGSYSRVPVSGFNKVTEVLSHTEFTERANAFSKAQKGSCTSVITRFLKSGRFSGW